MVPIPDYRKGSLAEKKMHQTRQLRRQDVSMLPAHPFRSLLSDVEILFSEA